uniref:Uncharacterized protein n=2 Tax=Rhodnius prolixus TaxID=13249 RepID=T1IBD6_RHOPR
MEEHDGPKDECKWHCREVATQLVEVQKLMSSSLLSLVRTLEDDVGVGDTIDKVSAIKDKYALLSRRVQELSAVSEPPSVKDLSRASSKAALSWASDYFTNLKNVIDDDQKFVHEQHANIGYLNNNTVIGVASNLTYPEKKTGKENQPKGFKGWLKKKFGNSSNESNSLNISDKKSFVQRGFVTVLSSSNTFAEKRITNDQQANVSILNGESLQPKLCVFDSNRMPLTDLHGNVLKDVFGLPLVLFDKKGKPVDRQGAPVFDSNGVSSTSQGFSPVEQFRMTKLSPVDLYDAKGYPLTGKDGHVLLNPTGETLVKFCRQGSEGLVLSDKDGGGVWDSKGIPVCSALGKWVDQEGRPYRFFMGNGMPVTDSKGRELYSIYGESLLMRDACGRPIHVQDTFGVSITAYAFDGTLHPPSETEIFCFFKGRPMKLYNCKGLPLTDEDGRVLFDSFGNPLVRVDFHNSPMKCEEDSPMFDERKFPLFCNPAKPIINMDGKPLFFYDKNKRPLTDRRGVSLVYASGILLLKFDDVGRPYADQKGKPLCDVKGNEIFEREFDATISANANPAQLKISYSSKPGFVVYDRSGRPLTDNEGNALVNSDGTSLEFNVIKQKKKVLKQEYDNFGRPLFDKHNRSLYCHGKPVFNSFGQKLMDTLEEETSTDFIRSGEYNKFGMPIKDKYLRDLYDENGAPYCDKTGTPESREIRHCEGILLSVSDEDRIIKIPKDLANKIQAKCFEQDGLLVGIPIENSIIP